MTLTPYPQLTPAQREALSELEIHPAQKAFSGDIEMALYTLLNCSSNDIQGFALLVDDFPRAFLLLKHGEFVPHWADAGAVTLHALQVDRRMQGRGLGRACMAGLPAAAMAAWPDVRRLELSVDADNEAAIRLYAGMGWVDTGEAYRGRIGFERRMVWLIEAAPVGAA